MFQEYYPPKFLRLRGVAFFCLTSTSIVWVVLLCFELFFRWDLLDKPGRSLILVILLANAITVVMLPILMILQFRPWLDAARLMFLLIVHGGSAVMFSIWTPKFQCSHNTVDEERACNMTNIAILIGSWINPALLLSYALGLSVMVYRRSQQPEIMYQDDPGCEEDEPPRIGLPPATPIWLVQTPVSVNFSGPSRTSREISWDPENNAVLDIRRSGEHYSHHDRTSTSSPARLSRQSRRLPGQPG
jgi:hypothetical protein